MQSWRAAPALPSSPSHSSPHPRAPAVGTGLHALLPPYHLTAHTMPVPLAWMRETKPPGTAGQAWRDGHGGTGRVLLCTAGQPGCCPAPATGLPQCWGQVSPWTFRDFLGCADAGLDVRVRAVWSEGTVQDSAWQGLVHSRRPRLPRLLQPCSEWLPLLFHCGLGGRGAAGSRGTAAGSGWARWVRLGTVRPAAMGLARGQAVLPGPTPAPVLRGCCPAPPRSWGAAGASGHIPGLSLPKTGQQHPAQSVGTCLLLPQLPGWPLPHPKRPGPPRAAWSICLSVLRLDCDLAPSRAAAGLLAREVGDISSAPAAAASALLHHPSGLP